MQKAGKKLIKIFGHEYWLLGIRKDGKKVFVQKPTWDCDWYWGGMYLACFTNNNSPQNSKDIAEHFHFDSTFLNSNGSHFDEFKAYFEETVLTDDEIWRLLDLMASAYALKKAAGVLHRGGSNYTGKARIAELEDDDMRTKINRKLLPAIFGEVKKLLTKEA